MLNINKKAAASLISWVLLVGLSITLAGIVTNWAIKTVKDYDPELSNLQDIYCPEVAISVNKSVGPPNVCDVKNRGLRSVVELVLVYNNGTSKHYPQKILPNNMSNLPDCTNLASIVPVSRVREDLNVTCPSKRYKIES